MTATDTIVVNGLKWFYRYTETDSQLPTVVLLHGIPAHSYIWRDVLDNLEAKKIKAIAPDWIGSGFSDKPPRRDFAYTRTAYAEALEALIEALELETCAIATQGYLASVGVEYALSHPETVKSLFILNTPISPQDRLPWKMQQWGIPLVAEMLTQDPLLVDRTLEGGSGYVISDQNLALHRQPYKQTSKVGRALANTVRNLQLNQTTAAISSGLATTEIPTSIIWGMQDPWLKTDIAALAKSNNFELVKLPEAKHYPQEHHASEVSNAIARFLQRQA